MSRKKIVAFEAPPISPEERERVHGEMERRVEEARRNGVYEQLLALRGKVTWSYTWEELRDKDPQE